MTQTDKFSARRVLMLWKLNRRTINRQLNVTLLLSVMSYFIMLGSTFTDNFLGLFTLASFLICVALVTGPLMLSNWRDKVFENQIPATAGEKTVFALLFTVVVVPLVVLIICAGLEVICSLFTENAHVEQYFFNSLKSDNPYVGEIPKWTYPVQQLQLLVPICACLLTVVTARRNVVVNGILAIVIAWVALSFIGGIYGIYLGFSAAMEGAPNSTPPSEEQISQIIMSSVSTIGIIIAALSIVCLGVTAWMLYRKYAYRQA